ncbi:SDR family oxidoreductase [Aestuariirhabdus litorea]|uniref:SDR family oxidoreductase n=1 Tax=Aestuariirhabdus litorea TaxID=2528527 RepID=A0A3P3VQW4_9GAMM|nr:SDR family oxidoreductase [Aestuariirhabdus litorea]RRJ83213.1 SDR family oxidoreductase [Aestuariirhabdus litorea]RWW93370.1 SDR family oxidoreductase [Endozoicomonadaceae bacterium GTF-13]
MKSVFITGAGSGIGRATALLFADRGWFVGAYDLKVEALETLAGELGERCCFQHCDVADRDSIARAFEQFARHSGGTLEVLVNCAGVLTGGRFAEMDPAALGAMIAINVQGLTDVAQLGYPLLKQTPGATLVNLCSASSVHGVPDLAVYSATKFYVNGLSEALAIEWAADDIRVRAIKPPLVQTAMGAAAPQRYRKRMPATMSAECVAEAIYACPGSARTSHLLGGKARLWGLVSRCLPEPGRRQLTRWLANY